LPTKKKFLGWTGIFLFFWMLFIFLPSFPAIRDILAKPLIVSNKNASGDAAYVLAGGYAFRERLLAASDLYHMNRIEKIILLKNEKKSSYHFLTSENFTLTEWWLDYLKWLGVPLNKILVLNPDKEGFFGTLNEVKCLNKHLDNKLRKIVMITSAPHTRRSLLAFNRVFKNKIQIIPYAASQYKGSIEMYEPLWLEYLKLIVYYLIA